MTTGISATLASGYMNILRNVAYTPPAALYVKLHTGDPGAAGTTAPSALTTRSLMTLAASAAGSPLSLSNAPTWTMSATETITHLSVWDASTGGVFQFSAILDTPQAVNSADILNLLGLTFAAGPQAA